MTTACLNYHILEVVRTLLIKALVLALFWVEAICTVVYLINHQTSSLLFDTTPYSRVYQKSSSYASLHAFRCICYVHLPRDRTKPTTQSVRCVFLGYAMTRKGFLCYDPSAKRFCMSRTFFL